MKRILDVISVAWLLLFGRAWHGVRCPAQSASADDWVTMQGIVGSIHGISSEPPANLMTPKFTSGALMGNGDIGVVEGDPEMSQQTLRFGKSDFRGKHWNAGRSVVCPKF